MDDEQKKAQRLVNLAKARARIIEIRAEKNKLNVKQNVDAPVKQTVDDSKNEDEDDSKDEPDPPPEPAPEPAPEPTIKIKKTPTKKKEVVVDSIDKKNVEPDELETKPVKQKPVEALKEPMKVEEPPAKPTFQRGIDGVWYF
jgi:hypothetical protein